MILQVRTKDNLETLLQNGNSPAWVIAEWRVKQIKQVEIYQFDGKRVIKADFDATNSYRTESERLVVAFVNGWIEESDMEWEGQNPIRYNTKSSEYMFEFPSADYREAKGKITIKVSGRIPKYLFATLENKYKEELTTAVSLCNGKIESDQDFLNLILGLTLEFAETNRIDFFDIISKEDLKKLPNFNQLVNYIIDEDWNHFSLIESDFLKVPDWNRGYLTMFESDSLISILKNDEKIFENVTLEDFTNQVDSWCTDDDEENQDLDSLELMKDLISKNEKHFGNPDSLYWGKNNEGCYFLEGYFTLPAFEKFIDESRINGEYNSGGQLSVYFDDISDWNFHIDTEDFQFGYLTFVNWSQCEQFRNSAYPCKFVQLFYKGEILIPEELRYRDKGITLSYEDETLDCLLNI
jgi:hypothetical protein